MSSAIYPAKIRGLTFNSIKRPDFDTIVQTSPNRYEVRIAQTQNPIWTWSLVYDYLKDNPSDIASGLTYTDLKTLMGFFLARQGKYDDFLYIDPDDNYVGPGMITGSPNLDAELPLITVDGISYSPLQRIMGGQFAEDIVDLIPNSLTGPVNQNIYANGVLKTVSTDYTVAGPGLAVGQYSYMGRYILWAGTPTPPITAEFHFYFRVRFLSDGLDFEKFMGALTPEVWTTLPPALWTMGGSMAKGGQGVLQLVTARPAII